MEKLEIGQKIEIHAFKHNGSLHRSWRNYIVIENTEKQLIVANYHAKVFEANGRNWFTQEPAISFFMRESFYNVIAMIKKDGIYFYCNLASPYIVDKEGLKYIDYDLDIRVKPDFTYVLLDQKEYKDNTRRYHYSKKLRKVIENQVKMLEQKIIKKEKPFDHQYIKSLYKVYKNIEKKI